MTTGEINTYEPAISVDQDRIVWIAYSQAQNGHRAIYMRSFDPETQICSEPLLVSGGGEVSGKPNISAHPSILCDSSGGLWITWQEPSEDQKMPCWFGARRCPVVCYRDGVFMQVAAQDSTHGSRWPMSGANNQHPVLRQDAKGRIWVFSREWRETRKWEVSTSMLNGSAGWTPAASLLEGLPMGRLSDPAVAIADDTSFWLVWQADGWLQQPIEAFGSTLHVARISTDSGEAENTVLENVAPVPSLPFLVQRKTRASRPRVSSGSDEYTVLYGNLHQHTLFSRCWVDGSDGEIFDNYRYGRDVERYDFLSLTDHGFDLKEAHWRASRRMARFHNDPPYLISLPAYEWTLWTDPARREERVDPGSGHRNIVFATDKDAAKWVNENGVVYSKDTPDSNRIDKVWRLLRKKGIRAVTIPHHPADLQHPMCWQFHDPEYETLVEIFQARESAEYPGCPRETRHITPLAGCHVSDALARGYQMGFIGSGDHNSQGIGLAAALVKEISPEGLFEALQSRRCFGTTGERILLDFQVNGHLMGETIPKPDTTLHLTARVEATAPLQSVVIFQGRDAVLDLTAAEIKGVHIWESELDITPVSHDTYYYLRAIQQDNEIAWSSPVYVSG